MYNDKALRPQLRFRAGDDKCIPWTRLGMLFGRDEKKKSPRALGTRLGLMEDLSYAHSVPPVHANKRTGNDLHVGVPMQRNGCQSIATGK